MSSLLLQLLKHSKARELPNFPNFILKKNQQPYSLETVHGELKDWLLRLKICKYNEDSIKEYPW